MKSSIAAAPRMSWYVDTILRSIEGAIARRVHRSLWWGLAPNTVRDWFVTRWWLRLATKELHTLRDEMTRFPDSPMVKRDFESLQFEIISGRGVHFITAQHRRPAKSITPRTKQELQGEDPLADWSDCPF